MFSDSRRFVLLLADDDPAQHNLVRRTLERTEFRYDFRAAYDGQQALDYLTRQGKFSDPTDSPRPDLLLLDMNMPKLDGREVLARIRQYEEFATLPVVVLSTSDVDSDVFQCYELGCNSYVKKPADMETFSKLVNLLCEYWLNVSLLPAPQEALTKVRSNPR